MRHRLTMGQKPTTCGLDRCANEMNCRHGGRYLFAHNRDGSTTSTQSRNLTACPIDRHPAFAARARRRRDRIECNLLHCICRLMARSCRTSVAEQCPKLGVERTQSGHAATAESDPTETLAASAFRIAKALFVPSPKRDIVASIACTQPPAGGVAWQSTSDGENSYSHWVARQLRGRSKRVRSSEERCGASDFSPADCAPLRWSPLSTTTLCAGCESLAMPRARISSSSGGSLKVDSSFFPRSPPNSYD